MIHRSFDHRKKGRWIDLIIKKICFFYFLKFSVRFSLAAKWTVKRRTKYGVLVIQIFFAFCSPFEPPNALGMLTIWARLLYSSLCKFVVWTLYALRWVLCVLSLFYRWVSTKKEEDKKHVDILRFANLGDICLVEEKKRI